MCLHFYWLHYSKENRAIELQIHCSGIWLDLLWKLHNEGKGIVVLKCRRNLVNILYGILCFFFEHFFLLCTSYITKTYYFPPLSLSKFQLIYFFFFETGEGGEMMEKNMKGMHTYTGVIFPSRLPVFLPVCNSRC